MNTWKLALFAGLFAIAGCKKNNAAVDAGVDAPDDNADAEVAACAVPTGGYGATVGRNLRPFTLKTCGEDEYSFYNDAFCDSTLTVVSIAAGWCGPCMQESAIMDDLITQAYADRGVRVIQILIQDEVYAEPSQSFCEGWVDRYGLTNIELRDPTQVTNVFFPDGSLPSTIIVDNQGVIRFRENGVSNELINLRNKLDELLAE